MKHLPILSVSGPEAAAVLPEAVRTALVEFLLSDEVLNLTSADGSLRTPSEEVGNLSLKYHLEAWIADLRTQRLLLLLKENQKHLQS